MGNLKGAEALKKEFKVPDKRLVVFDCGTLKREKKIQKSVKKLRNAKFYFEPSTYMFKFSF